MRHHNIKVTKLLILVNRLNYASALSDFELNSLRSLKQSNNTRELNKACESNCKQIRLRIQ